MRCMQLQEIAQVPKSWNPIAHRHPHFLFYSDICVVLSFLLQEPLKTRLCKDMMTSYLLPSSNIETVIYHGLIIHIHPTGVEYYCVSFKSLKFFNLNIPWHPCNFMAMPQCTKMYSLVTKAKTKNTGKYSQDEMQKLGNCMDSPHKFSVGQLTD